MALCLPTLKLFKQKHNPFKTLQPCARSSSSCTSSSFLTSLFSLRLKPLFVFICLYLFLFVFICLYLSLFVFNLSLFVFICQNLPILSNKPCRSNPCCSGSVQTANDLGMPQTCFPKPYTPARVNPLTQNLSVASITTFKWE